MPPRFSLTPRQRDARELLKDPAVRYLLLAGGSRSGKTSVLCYALVLRALSVKCRQVILRFHFNDVRQSVGMDTLPKILDLLQPADGRGGFMYELDRTNWVFRIHSRNRRTGRMFVSEIWLAGLDDKERTEKILGKEFSTIYLNEASQISYRAYTTALTRLAENSGLHNKVYIDCNPPEKTHWLYQLFVQKRKPGTLQEVSAPARYRMFVMNPADNPHLPPEYLETLESLPDRERRRFLEGEWLDKRQGSLFRPDDIERSRVTAPPAYLSYGVVAVDPAVSAGDDADETGIVSVACDAGGEFYVLRDDSVNGSPAEWAAQVNAAYGALELDAAVYETNQGGDMVGHCIRVANPLIPCHGVRATRGKAVRAEPVAALYEEGRVHHVGYFPELEDQMTGWVPGDTKSPDRMDALVWAITYLMNRPGPAGEEVMEPVASHDGCRKYSFGKSEGQKRPPAFGRGRGRWR